MRAACGPKVQVDVLVPRAMEAKGLPSYLQTSGAFPSPGGTPVSFMWQLCSYLHLTLSQTGGVGRWGGWEVK